MSGYVYKIFNTFKNLIHYLKSTNLRLNKHVIKEEKLFLVKNKGFEQQERFTLNGAPNLAKLTTNTLLETKDFSFFSKKKHYFFETLISWISFYRIVLLNIWKKTIGDGFLQLQATVTILYVDALLTDDEPIWEPVEWSLIQSWILFTFLFGWISENLISSRYGSYAGRDKRVWFAWYKNAWLVIAYYAMTIGAAALFVIVPFYHEVSSLLPLTVSWWDWYNRTFFTNFIGFYVLILFLGIFFQLSVRSFNWKKSWNLILLINLLLFYLLYGQFFSSFFSYLTDPNWYHKTRLVDYIQLSHEPNKWSWGNSKRDHFSYHKSSTVFWYKNDIPFAGALMIIHLHFFWSLFGVSFFWITLTRRVFAIQEISYTYATYAVSTLKQFFLFFFLFLFLILHSYLLTYWRLPLEFLWAVNNSSWIDNFLLILNDYCSFLTALVF